MKKFLLLGSAALCVMSMTANTPAVRFVNIGKKPLPEAVAKSRAAVKAASQTRIWRPAKYTEYHWEITDPETWAGDWKGSGTTVCTYNMAGQVTSKVNDYVKHVYEYDAEGRCILSASYSNENGTFIPEHKTEFAYDDIVKNLVIDEKFYYYRENKWTLEESYRTIVTRNADGNITQIKAQMSRPGSQDWQDATLMEVGYGSDKKANAIKAYGYEEGKAEIEFELVDVIWDRTDGQIVIGNYGDDQVDMSESGDLEDLFMGANRIKSAKAPAATNYPYAGDIYYNAEYKPENGGYKMTATMNGSTYMSEDYTVLDAYGSYTAEVFEIDYDHMDDGTYQPDGPQLDEYTEIYDAYGLKLKNSEISYVDADKSKGIEYQSEYIGTVTYDDTYGYPLEYFEQRSYMGGTPENVERVVYSDYFDAYEAGVTDVETSDNAPVEYFNLQGVRVDNPSNGLYIRRQGNKTTKVLVK